MFEKDEDYRKARKESKDRITKVIKAWCAREEVIHDKGFEQGAEYGYNKGKEDVKYDLMMKLKDEGIVIPLKDSIFYNQRLSSQEQQELCSWIECAMDFGENLDEAVERIEKLEKIILKLRNCKNCKFGEHNGYLICAKKGIAVCSKWEMKECY